MNNQIKYILNIAGTGILLIVLLGIIFFWADKIIDSAILDGIKPNDFGIVIQPSGLIEDEEKIIKQEKDKYYPSAVKASMNHNILFTLGMFRDFVEEETRFQGLSMTSVAYDIMTDNISSTIKPETFKNSDRYRTYFDKNIGLFVNCRLSNSFSGQNKRQWTKKINYYIGPEGIADEPTEQLGKFVEPFTGEIKPSPFYGTAVFYDKGLSRFFKLKITPEEKTITKGPELDPQRYNPIQIGNYEINSPKYNMLVNNFVFHNTSNNKNQAAAEKSRLSSHKYLTIVNQNGKIDLLNNETLELKPAGQLPEYVKKQYAYSIRPVFFNDYIGLMVSTISSNFNYIEIYVFDAAGEQVKGKRCGLDKTKLPGGIASILGKYIIENLQPAGFNILSYLTTHNYDGSKSQQALFVRPNSIIARIGKTPLLLDLLATLVAMGPSLIIGVILGWRVSKRAKALGLSKLTVRIWTYGVILTGIAGYLTFRLTKHNQTMVTCKNCGQLRCVEQQTCHNCKADWQMKHLKSADWKIISC